MKKIILLIILIHLIIVAKSQFYISGKIGTNYGYLNTKSFEQNPVIGYQIGLTSSYVFNEKFIFQPEILISLKGGELKAKKSNSSDYFDYLKTKKTYIDFPILLKYRVTGNNKIDFYINSGINLGFCIWTNQTDRSVDMVSSINGPDFNNAFGFGVIGGIGFDLFNMSTLEFRYEYGITDVLGFPNESYSNRVISIALSYRLSKNNE
jgi:opacity protein-like surface antigen